MNRVLPQLLLRRSVLCEHQIQVRTFCSPLAKDRTVIHRSIGIDAEGPSALAMNYMPEEPGTIDSPSPVAQAQEKKKSGARRKSGMQLEILKLYREILRASKAKDPPGTTRTYDAARIEFRRQVSALLGRVWTLGCFRLR
jgi:hypothetical protein